MYRGCPATLVALSCNSSYARKHWWHRGRPNVHNPRWGPLKGGGGLSWLINPRMVASSTNCMRPHVNFSQTDEEQRGGEKNTHTHKHTHTHKTHKHAHTHTQTKTRTQAEGRTITYMFFLDGPTPPQHRLSPRTKWGLHFNMRC